MHKKLKELEQKIGYRFRNFSFLEQAMMHSSYTNEHRMEKYRCNERLEFLGNAKEFIHRFVLTDQEDKKLFYDSKTILQEIVQAEKLGEIEYHLIGEEGPDHNKSFSVELTIRGRSYGKGKGRTKKAAEQQAAYEAIHVLKKR